MKAKLQRLSFSFEDADPDTITQFYSRHFSPLKFEAASANGLISKSHYRCNFDEWSLWHTSTASGMRLSYDAADRLDELVVYFPLHGNMQIEIGQSVQDSQPGAAFIGEALQVERMTLGKGREHNGIAVSKTAITRQLSEMIDEAVVRDVTFVTALDLRAPPGIHFAAFVDFLMRQVVEEHFPVTAGYWRHLQHALISMILEAVPNNFTKYLSGKVSPAVPRNLKKAIDFMHANLREQITVMDVAKEAETSVRALQASFRQFKDTTPLLYLRALRLQAVRELLLNPSNDQTIAEIARANGFTNLGRFAKSYRDAFGEMPSVTSKWGERK